MSTYTILDTTLTSIADAIREKAGTTDLIKVSDLPSAIANIPSGGGGGEELPEEALKITDICAYRFAEGGWDWFIEKYGNQITTENLDNVNYMFNISASGITPKLEVIPFDFNFKAGTGSSGAYMFGGCSALKQIGDFYNWRPTSLENTFVRCYSLRELPNFINMDLSYMHSNGSARITNTFYQCYSLRKIDSNLLKELYTPGTTGNYVIYSNGFHYNSVLDELVGVPVAPGTLTSNRFSSNTFGNCFRLKNIIFDTNEDGTPKTANWKSQTIDLTLNIGYSSNRSYILSYNSGITADKEVTDEASYQALKDDPDWFSMDINYSRYNHDSAVATINSLPDTSAYGTNTIKFKGAAGALTDGGAINTLTEEEIAVATAKGWTVTLA